MSGTLTVYRWELRKLLSQKRTYIGLLFATARNEGPRSRMA